MTFRIWNDQDGGIELWKESRSVTINDGLFNVRLGSITPMPEEIFASPCWLEIQIGNEALSPRNAISSYSLKAPGGQGNPPFVNKTGDSKNPVVRQKLAQLAIETEVCHLLAYKIAAAEDAKLPIVNEASMSKIMNAELMRYATGIATEIVGLGSQLTEDETDAPCLGRLGHLHFDSIANAFGAGTIEIQKNTIARFGLGLPREPRG